MPKAVQTLQEIELPDGSIGEFPADMKSDAIERAIRERFPETRQLAGADPKEPIKESEATEPYSQSIAGGTLRGLAGTLDLPARGVDWVSRKLGYTPEGSPTPFTDLADAYGPAPVENYDTLRNASEIVGPVVVEGALSGGALVPSALAQGGIRTALRTGTRRAIGSTLKGGASTGIGMAAGQAGGELGQAIGGDTGEDIGATVASLFAPQALGRTARGIGRSLLTDEGSAKRLRDADIAGVRPSLGLVGNKFAGLAEDMTVGIPFAGGPAYSMRRGQYSDMDASAQRIADAARGRPAAGPISEGSVGQGVQDTANAAVDANQGAISRSQDALAQDIGPASVVRDVGVSDQISTMLADATVSQEVKDSLRQRQTQMNRDRNQVVDPAEATAIEQGQAQVDRWEAAMRAAASQGTPVTPGQSALLGQMQTRIQQERALLARRLDENTGTTYGATKDLRTNLGRTTADSVPLPTKLLDPLYGETTDAMRQRGVDSGVPAERFDAVQADSRTRFAENERLAPLAEQQNQGSSYTQMFSPRNEQNVSLLDILSDRAPSPLAQTLGDNLELKTRGEAAAGTPGPNPETMNPKALSSWWSGLDDSAKVAYVRGDPAELRRMNALADTAAADTRRPTRALPGKGGNTIGAPLVFGLQGSGIGTGIASGSPLLAALAASPTVLARGLGGAMTSEGMTRSLVEPPRPFLDPQNLLPAIQALRGATGGVPR